MSKRNILTLLLIPIVSLSMMGQNDRKFIREGNKYFHQKHYDKAETAYRKAAAVNSQNAVAQYNLGCALMMQRKDSLSVLSYEKAGKLEKDPLRRSKAYHNMGVVLQNHQQYEPAIEAYKESLRNNPNDNETRYNLALCQKMLKKQQQNQQNQNQQNKQQDKQQNQQDQQDKKQQQNQQQKNQNEQNNDKDSNDQQQKKMSRENAEQMLNAAMQEEKRTQEKLEKAIQGSQKRSLEKNW